MNASFIIYRHESAESADLVRDVRHQHPAWVHAQIGTDSESELQGVLDSLNPYDYANDGIGDSDGIRLADPQIGVVNQDGDRGIVLTVAENGLTARVLWDHGDATTVGISDLTID